MGLFQCCSLLSFAKSAESDSFGGEVGGGRHCHCLCDEGLYLVWKGQVWFRKEECKMSLVSEAKENFPTMETLLLFLEIQELKGERSRNAISQNMSYLIEFKIFLHCLLTKEQGSLHH